MIRFSNVTKVYGKDTIAILREHVESPVPPIRDLVPELPGALAGIVEKLLEKKPSARYPLVDALAAALAETAPDARRRAFTCPTTRPKERLTSTKRMDA